MAADERMVRMEHIGKTFNPGSVNERVLFDDFNLTLRKHDFVSVVGSNGSGKTTMLNILCGTLPQDSGQVIVADQDIRKLAEYERARFIGRVFQDPAKGTCAALTILENMSLADHKGNRFGLTPGINRRRRDFYRAQLELLGMGLENNLEITAGSLSGGQRQALAMLISTMTPIDLLILDEHTAALDPRSSETVMALTKKVVEEKKITTLMVTHNLKFAVTYGNRLLMMHRGEAVVDVQDEEKSAYRVENLLEKFNEISIEAGNSL